MISECCHQDISAVNVHNLKSIKIANGTAGCMFAVYVSELHDQVIAHIMLNDVKVGIITIYHYYLQLRFTENLIQWLQLTSVKGYSNSQSSVMLWPKPTNMWPSFAVDLGSRTIIVVLCAAVKISKSCATAACCWIAYSLDMNIEEKNNISKILLLLTKNLFIRYHLHQAIGKWHEMFKLNFGWHPSFSS